MGEEGRRTYKKSSVVLGVTLAIILCLLTASNLYILQSIRELEADIVQLTEEVNELEAVIRSSFEGELSAEVVVDASNSIGAIDRNVYGHFIEHLDNCVYNGVWVGKNSWISNLRGLRMDVLEAVDAMEAPIIRWPGGNFASDYHWEDGVGSPEERPECWNRPWNAVETNQFGTHEFIDFCREVNAEPYIVVNMVSGNSSEAANWVEYCNSREGEWAQKRAANGHSGLFNVPYWGLGNEMYGEWQYDWQSEVPPMNASEYANKAVEFAMNMRQADPSIKLIAVGWYENDNWNREVLEVDGEHIDYVSVHKYYDRYDYYTVVAHPLLTERRLKEIGGLIDEVMGENGRVVKIAFDEWNLGEPSKFFYDSLFAAGMFNTFHRMCNEVTMANLAQLVNVLHACIATNEQGQSYVTPVYLAFKLYAENTGDIALNTLTKGDYYLSHGIQKVPFLDCSATIDNHDKTLYLAAINRHKTDAMKCKIELRNFNIPKQCTFQELNADNITATNGFLNPNSVKITGGSTRLNGNPFFYTFPPCSVTILELTANSSSQPNQTVNPCRRMLNNSGHLHITTYLHPVLIDSKPEESSESRFLRCRINADRQTRI
jgi:alpha-N-arabinofuranosidase